jgi:hypothetical protein
MRKPIFRVAMCLVLLTPVSWSWAQVDMRRPTTQEARPPAPSETAAPTARSRGNVTDQAIQVRPATIKPLTAEECRTLGGTVHTEVFGLCNSGRFCGRTDQDGKVHRVCITAQ